MRYRANVNCRDYGTIGKFERKDVIFRSSVPLSLAQQQTAAIEAAHQFRLETRGVNSVVEEKPEVQPDHAVANLIEECAQHQTFSGRCLNCGWTE